MNCLLTNNDNLYCKSLPIAAIDMLDGIQHIQSTWVSLFSATFSATFCMLVSMLVSHQTEAFHEKLDHMLENYLVPFAGSQRDELLDSRETAPT